MDFHNRLLTLRRIGKIRFFTIVSLSVISIIILSYQTIEYIQNSCGCGENIPEIIEAFRECGNIGGVPISFIGLICMGAIIIQLFFLSSLPNTFKLNIFKSLFGKELVLTQRGLKFWYHLFLIELASMSIAVLTLIYIELFIIDKVCVYCTVSQITILLSTILIWKWNPFHEQSKFEK